MLATYLRWWLEHEAPKGKPGRAPLAATTLKSYRSNIETHLIPALGNRKVADLTVTEPDRFANARCRRDWPDHREPLPRDVAFGTVDGGARGPAAS